MSRANKKNKHEGLINVRKEAGLAARDNQIIGIKASIKTQTGDINMEDIQRYDGQISVLYPIIFFNIYDKKIGGKKLKVSRAMEL